MIFQIALKTKMKAQKTLFVGFLILVSSHFFTSCDGLRKAKKIATFIQKDKVHISLQNNSHDSVKMIYTGCSGFFIHDPRRNIIIDPFFSNPGPMLSLGFKKIKTDTVEILQFIQQHPEIVKATSTLLLNDHCHYDHAMDIPYFYHRLLNNKPVTIAGNRNLFNVMKASEKVYGRQFEEDDFVINEDLAEGTWIYTPDSTVRVLPILANHGPQFANTNLYTGSLPNDLDQLPHKAAKWKEGQTYTYLIDFIEENSVVFRFYHNSAPTANNLGLPSQELINERPVDIAIICVASFKYTKEYPKNAINYLQPRHVVLSHWENFFQPLSKHRKNSYVVPFTNVQKFLVEFEQQYPDLEFTLPQPYTQINVQY